MTLTSVEAVKALIPLNRATKRHCPKIFKVWDIGPGIAIYVGQGESCGVYPSAKGDRAQVRWFMRWRRDPSADRLQLVEVIEVIE